MLEQFVYEDHNGRRFTGREFGVYLNYNDLRDYSWGYDTINNRISRFYQTVTNRKLPLTIMCKTVEEAIHVKHKLLEYTEADIAAKVPGRVYVGDYYTMGYITSSVKANYLMDKRYCTIELTLTSDNPAWYREQRYVFGNASENVGSATGADYPYDYPYDYGVMMNGKRITCDTLTDSAFRMTIYGMATDPRITINGHDYTVAGQVGIGETLTIDSLTKRITLTTRSGEQVNWFDKRGRTDYIFQPIPPGIHVVSWIGDFGFDLTVIEKRSEPKWI